MNKDFLTALLLGSIAGPLSLIILKNLDIPIPWYYPIAGFPLITVAGIGAGRALSGSKGSMGRFVKFAEVGGLNWLVDLGVINLMVMLTGVASGLITVLYKALSFSVAVANSYFWNKSWVFHDAVQQSRAMEMGKFLMASLMGLGINLIVFSAVKFGGQASLPGIPAATWINLAAVTGSISAMIFNFVLYKAWVFKK